jgi:hypothetical protein
MGESSGANSGAKGTKGAKGPEMKPTPGDKTAMEAYMKMRKLGMKSGMVRRNTHAALAGAAACVCLLILAYRVCADL